MTRDEIMTWYKECEHEIVISQTNKGVNYSGMAICNKTAHTYTSSGDDICGVINDLRLMLEGGYKK